MLPIADDPAAAAAKIEDGPKIFRPDTVVVEHLHHARVGQRSTAQIPVRIGGTRNRVDEPVGW